MITALRKQVCILLVIFSCSLLVQACGQKGDLYHPKEPQSSLPSQHLTA